MAWRRASTPTLAMGFAFALTCAQRADAQSSPTDWLVQTLVTAGAALAADWIADEPGLGAAFGVAYAAGNYYMGLRVEDWEVGETNRGAGMISAVVIGIAVTILLDDEDGEMPAPPPPRRPGARSHPQRDARLEPVLLPGPAGFPVPGHPQLAPWAETPLELERIAAASTTSCRGVQILLSPVPLEVARGEPNPGLEQVRPRKAEALVAVPAQRVPQWPLVQRPAALVCEVPIPDAVLRFRRSVGDVRSLEPDLEPRRARDRGDRYAADEPG